MSGSALGSRARAAFVDFAGIRLPIKVVIRQTNLPDGWFLGGEAP
ncbi:MAG: hypothetical protein N3G20_10020 [Verrucomicrobiae bacterium]|nr:hypothetical protein [Verrucomicrobiae bacterium]